MELNREQIIKALECCTKDRKSCKGCPLNNWNELCVELILKNALALITSQEQRIGAQDMTISELRKRAEKAEHDADRYSQKIKELTEENKAISERYAIQVVTAIELDKQVQRLTEENEAWQKQLITTEEQSGKAYYDLACEVEDLRAENERLRKALSTDISIVRVSRGSGKTAHLREVGRIKVDAIRADTVRKMQERINAHFDSDSDYFRSSHGYIRNVVDQIAKEMLKGETP